MIGDAGEPVSIAELRGLHAIFVRLAGRAMAHEQGMHSFVFDSFAESMRNLADDEDDRLSVWTDAADEGAEDEY